MQRQRTGGCPDAVNCSTRLPPHLTTLRYLCHTTTAAVTGPTPPDSGWHGARHLPQDLRGTCSTGWRLLRSSLLPVLADGYGLLRMVWVCGWRLTALLARLINPHPRWMPYRFLDLRPCQRTYWITLPFILQLTLDELQLQPVTSMRRYVATGRFHAELPLTATLHLIPLRLTRLLDSNAVVNLLVTLHPGSFPNCEPDIRYLVWLYPHTLPV